MKYAIHAIQKNCSLTVHRALTCRAVKKGVMQYTGILGSTETNRFHFLKKLHKTPFYMN